MAAVLLFLLAVEAASAGSSPEVPAALTEVNPALALRWRELRLTREGRSVGTLTDAATAVELGAPVVRVRGAFSAGCEPRASRIFSTEGAQGEVPLPPPARSGADFLAVLPPPLAPPFPRDGERTTVTVALALPAGCAPVPARAFEPGEDGDPDAGNLVATELQRLLGARPDDRTLARWLEAPHPHRWQEEAALALALPRLLGDAPGSMALARGRLALATAELRTREIAFSIRRDLGAGPGRSLPGSEGTWYAVPAAGHLELDVRGDEVVRLWHRAPLPDRAAMMSWRLTAAFDHQPATWLLAQAPADPEAPATTRARGRVLLVPPGARQLRLGAPDGPVLVWAEGAHAKPGLPDLFRPSASALLEEARRAGGLTAALAGASAERPPPAPRESGPPVPLALLAVARAERASDPAVAELWLGRAAERLREARTPLEHAAAGIIEAMSARVRAARAVAAGAPGEAMNRLLALAARRPLDDEDAQALLDADGFAQDSLSGSPQALLAVDGLLARRPLDRGLALARQRAYAGASRWQELSTDPGPREVHFLDPLPPDSLAAPEHSRFVAIVPGTAREVELPVAPLPGHLPLLAVVAMRPPGAPPLLRVNVDGTPFTVPAVGPLERVDLPVRPGRHRVELGSSAGATQLLVNWAGGGDPGRRWRRYLEVGSQPVEMYNRDVGGGDILAVSVRVVGPAGSRPAPVTVALSGDGMRPLSITVRPGPLVPAAPGELDADLGASAPVEAIVPVASRNPSFRLSTTGAAPGVRVLVHVSARRRSSVTPFDGAPPDPGADDSLQTVAALTGRLSQRSTPALYLARAAALAGAGEAALAREDLVRALGGKLAAPSRRLALAIWRHLDDVGSSSYPETVDHRSAWVHSPGFGLVLGAMPADLRALGRLADDREALRRLPPATLVAGEAPTGDYALLAAARQAERDGAWARAAELWHALAAAHDDAGLQARAAASLLALPPDPLRDVTAYVDLLQATQLDPQDPVAERLFRRAAARTRLRPLHDVDDSAGTVTLSAPSADNSVEAALLPETARTGELVTGERQLTLSLDLAAPMMVRLHAQVRELRPAATRAVGRPPIAVAWVKDGEVVNRVPCPVGEVSSCRSGPITLPAGSHSLVVRLDGGLRPAGRVTVEPVACRPGSPRARSAVARTAEYLVARGEQPVVVSLFGPGAVEVELRAGPATARRQVSLAVLPAGAAQPSVRRVSLAASSSETSVVETLVLDRDHAYRLEVRPTRGEVLCRLRLRDGIGTGAVPPPAVPAALAAAGPAPLLPAPDLERGLAAEVRDGDVALGWDDAGALALDLGWQSSVEVADAETLVNNSARTGALTYRRLVDRLHLTLKLGGEGRLWSAGSPSVATLLHGYFQHPDARWARVLAAFDGATQTVNGQRAAGADALVMFEPVATLRSGLHLISKLGMRWHWQSLDRLPDDQLGVVDPAVFNRYAARHPRALFLEEGFELAPLRDLLFYAGGRVTSNPALSLRHPDRLSGMAVMRGALGRFTLSAGLRGTWFLGGPDRTEGFLRRTAALEVMHTFWLGHTNALTVGLEASQHIDVAASELGLRVGWELSNGRRLRDHTAVEGENYFYPQRGPGREEGRLVVP
jgi:hypothetical protein